MSHSLLSFSKSRKVKEGGRKGGKEAGSSSSQQHTHLRLASLMGRSSDRWVVDTRHAAVCRFPAKAACFFFPFLFVWFLFLCACACACVFSCFLFPFLLLLLLLRGRVHISHLGLGQTNTPTFSPWQISKNSHPRSRTTSA